MKIITATFLIPIRFFQILYKGIQFLMILKFTKDETKKPQKLKEIFEYLGGVFTKIGQIISMRSDFIDPSYQEQLFDLQDKPKPFSYEKGIRIINKGLKNKNYFRVIEKELFASGSISQIYKAIDQEGREVIIKVKRPHISLQILIDVSILKVLLLPLKLFGLDRSLKIYQLIHEAHTILKEESDFRQEIKNLQLFETISSSMDKFITPKVYIEACNSNIITMDYISGVSFKEIMSSMNKGTPILNTVITEKLAIDFFEIIMKMIFEVGFFHGDPHSGNILYTQDEKIAFLDFGAVGCLSERMKFLQINYFNSIANNNLDEAVDFFIRILRENKKSDSFGFRKDLKSILYVWMMKIDDDNIPFSEKSLGSLMMESSFLATKYKFTLRSNSLLFFRVFLLVEPIFFNFNPTFNLKKATEKYITQYYLSKYGKELNYKKMMSNMYAFSELIQILPSWAKKLLIENLED
ncbi:MAG: AarF/UbiB family protein [Bacteroidota bacterium]